MIIRSLRLKNIKSYGEGPGGDGVTVHFERGINRIAGKNGHGKSTLIESLGYALFLTEPIHEESFNVASYLLRAGAKSGEIDVVFDCGGQTYRLERGLGAQQKRRAKVVLVNDGSTEAEGDAEVAAYLCRLFGFADAGRLSELFSKLIGVKQGRLAWPFDSKPGDARKHFEPLLDVEIFRLCFDRLKPVIDRFEELKHERKEELAAIEERIKERADSPQKLSEARQAMEAQTTALEKSVQARDRALEEKLKQEGFEKAVSDAKAAKDRAATTALNAKEKREEAEKRFRESEQASKTVSDSKPAHEAYEAAERALHELEGRRKVRDDHRTKRDKSEYERNEREANARAAREQRALLKDQRNEKETQRAALSGRITALRTALDSGKAAFDQTQREAEVAEADQATINGWVQGLSRSLKRLELTAASIATLSSDLSAWDSAKLEAARQAERAAAGALNEGRDLLAKAQARNTSLSEQLNQIRGGVCPFLKETCRQFDPAKVQADLSNLDLEVTKQTTIVKQAQKQHETAQNALSSLIAGENRLSEKRQRLSGELARYREEFGSIIPPGVTAAFRRLRAWDRGISVEPALVAVPDRELTAQDVLGLERSIETFAAEGYSWWTTARPTIQRRVEGAEQKKAERTRQEADLKTLSGQLEVLDNELTRLGQDTDKKDRDATRLEDEAAGLKKSVEAYVEQLKPYAELDSDLDARKTIRNNNKAGHELYLKVKALADELELRRKQFDQRKLEEEQAIKAVNESADALTKAQESFDQSKLNDARNVCDIKLAEATTAQANLVHVQAELARQETRFGEWESACRNRTDLFVQLGRLQACMDLTQIARRVLQKAAPKVAQHVCRRVAARAQQIFNQINPEPVELEWMAERYSLRINPGDRRFAMLSGGEQTKLALAMTLAMIQEFSGLQFCVFDEPTYAVDADSRQKLADAILRLQDVNESKLDQLLLVSHDDAFEGRIENMVLIRKTINDGSLPCDPSA
jgi:exonuclease SbcC